MRILVFCPFSPYTDGGVQRVVDKLARMLGERNHSVYQISHEEQCRKVSSVSNPENHWTIPVEHLRTWHKLPRLDSTWRMCRSAMRIHQLLSQIRPDVVNCHFANFSSLYFLLLRPFHHYRLVISTHGSDVLVPLNDIHDLILPYLLRGACHVTAVSHPLMEAASEIADIVGHASTIHNGIDYEFWSRGARIAGHADLTRTLAESTRRQDPVVVNVGALRYAKGQDVLIEAFAQLCESFPRAELRLVGDGDYKHELTRQADRLGVRERVTFHGWCSRQEVRRILETSTVFSFPSRSEGFGLALLEAMAAGLPVVASRVGGIPDLIDSGQQGILVVPEDPSSLASALATVLTDEDQRERMGRKATSQARKFSWERTVDAYEDLYYSII